MLRHEGDLFLDGTSLDEVERRLGVRTVTVPDDGCELLNLIVGSE